MGVKEHFTWFAQGEQCLLPAESHHLVRLGMLDTYNNVIEPSKLLTKVFFDASLLR